MDRRDDPEHPKMSQTEDVPVEEDLTGGGLLPPGVLDVDVAEMDSEAGSPASLDIVGVDDRSTGWGDAEPVLPIQ